MCDRSPFTCKKEMRNTDMEIFCELNKINPVEAELFFKNRVKFTEALIAIVAADQRKKQIHKGEKPVSLLPSVERQRIRDHAKLIVRKIAWYKKHVMECNNTTDCKICKKILPGLCEKLCSERLSDYSGWKSKLPEMLRRREAFKSKNAITNLSQVQSESLNNLILIKNDEDGGDKHTVVDCNKFSELSLEDNLLKSLYSGCLVAGIAWIDG